MPGKRPPLPRGPARRPQKSRPRKRGGYAEKVAASVHIYNALEMTKKGRREIAAWLRKHADWLLKEGDNYAKSFRGRYFYAVRV